MNILFLSQIVPYPPQGGVLQRGYYLIKELGKDHVIDLVAFHHPDILERATDLRQAESALSEFCRSVSTVPLPAKKSRVHLLYGVLSSFLSIRPFSFFAYRSREFRQRIESLYRKNDYDIVHVDTLALSQYMPDYIESKTTLTHHNVESDLMRRRSANESHFLKKLYYFIDSQKNRRAERFWIPRYDLNITCSSVDSAKLVEIAGAHKTVNIPNGVDTAYFAPQYDQQNENTIIHVGALQSSNLDGIQYFLSDIWPLIVGRRKNVEFLLVGKSDREALKAYIKGDRRIHQTGHVPDIRSYVHQASVFVVPLRIGGGTKLKVLDALSNGKAVVTTSIGAEGIAVENGRHLFIADEPRAFAAAVTTLLEDRDLRISIGNAGRELVAARYDWSVVGNRLSSTYTELDQNRRSRDC